MPLRKRLNKDHTGVSCESKQEVNEPDNSQEDQDEPSQSLLIPTAAREKRLRQRENKTKHKDMTEEEMMDMALRLSEQEANITARRLQEEEEAMRKALQDSMMSESQSQNLITEAPLCFSTRRKLVYSNGESQTGTQGFTLEAEGTQELNKCPEPRAGHGRRNKKRRRVEGSPLTEMPDLSQSQHSPSSSESVPLGSPQSCDLTQIEDCDIRKSPAFPTSSRQASVHVPRLSQNLLDSCSNTGFILVSQDSCMSAQRSPLHKTQRHSPTFPKSPAPRPSDLNSTNAPSQTDIVDLGDDTEPSLSPLSDKSPVFESSARHDNPSRSLKQETSETSGHMFSSQESLMSFCLEKDVVDHIKSPVFSKTQQGGDRAERSPVLGMNGRIVRTIEETGEDGVEETHNISNLSEKELTSDMTLRWSDEEDNNDVTPVASPSPVFPEERSVLQTNNETASDQPTCSVNPAVSQSGDTAEVPCFAGDSGAQSTVHYYWGVPFCPRGLNPDEYTKVIVAQMEVYEKSLKQAQRRLMKKADWGEPILPQPEKSPSPESNSPQIHLTRRWLRRRRGKVEKSPRGDDHETVDEDTQTQEDTQRDQDIQPDEEGTEEGQVEQEEGLEEQRPEEDQHRDTETQVDSDCDVCPETQLSDNDNTDLTLPPELPVESPEVETVQVDSLTENQSHQEHEEKEEEMEEEQEEEEVMEVESEQYPNCSKVRSRPADAGVQASESQSREHSGLEKSQSSQGSGPQKSKSSDDPGLQRSWSPEFDPVVVPSPQGSVQCPICLRPFPTAEIELHAALCDGEPPAGDRASPRPRRTRTRQAEAEDTNHTMPSEKSSVNPEKCFICLRAVPLREYSRHTERCLQRASRTAAAGGLLSALDQSEHRDSEAGPSGTRVQPQEVIDLRDDEEDVCEIRISNSPIRSFTSISETEDCLIDFRKHHRAKKPGPKPGLKRR